MDPNTLTSMLKMPWVINKSIFDLLDIDTEMYIRPDKDDVESIVGLNMFKALKDVYQMLRDDKEEGMRWLDELGRMVVIGTFNPDDAKEFVHETMVQEHMRNLDNELDKLINESR